MFQGKTIADIAERAASISSNTQYNVRPQDRFKAIEAAEVRLRGSIKNGKTGEAKADIAIILSNYAALV